ncbi:glycosyltransferase [Flavisolibacter tropicus]|uniref:Mannosyl transferase n=1 Tax=Flavisolibacter tropicus TaxID=1492898 RepID=A0A172TQK1_9BACT|nr:glycosyltransferase [Flavisolibacter tropicus]ANE49262.1 mannosyl transferase [Flavisolibacter tropicus]
MNIVFFAHPDFLHLKSMIRYTNMLVKGMRERGHNVEVWSPNSKFLFLTSITFFKKWLGYLDQYILFPIKIRHSIKICPSDTLFVFTDHALGPWVPLVSNRPHIIHCHDFLAQRSALNEIAEHKTGWTGRRYQNMIYNGYSKAKNFISVSQKTKEDLHQFLPYVPQLSEVVYNGFNQTFIPHDAGKARALLSSKTGIELTKGYLLHVGGNQWYKNRIGVLEIYEAFRSKNNLEIPLLMVGDMPDHLLNSKVRNSIYKKDIHFLTNINDCFLNFCYSGASVFVFPSFAEGFGWPIAEAMASGCPVITTNEAPMTEVAGQAGFLIPRRPSDDCKACEWAYEAAKVVKLVLSLLPNERKAVIDECINNIERFNAINAISRIESIYEDVMKFN